MNFNGNVTIKIHVGFSDSTLSNSIGYYVFSLDSLPNAFYFSYHKQGYYSDSTSAVIINGDLQLPTVILYPLPDTHSISGIINLTNTIDNSGVTIKIDAFSNSFASTTFSDSMGLYQIPFIDSGLFSITYSKDGYRSENRNSAFC